MPTNIQFEGRISIGTAILMKTFLKPYSERPHLRVNSVFSILLSCFLVLNHRTVRESYGKEGKMLAANMIQLEFGGQKKKKKASNQAPMKGKSYAA